MKFLPFFMVSFVLAVIPDGLDANEGDGLYHSFRVSKELVESQAAEIASLGESLRDVKDEGEMLTQNITKVVQLLHDIKIENKGHKDRTANNLKAFHDLKTESNWLTQKVDTALKSLHLAKVESEWKEKKVANLDNYWYWSPKQTKFPNHPGAEPEKLKYHKGRADHVAEAENLLHALKEKSKWQKGKVEIVESLLSDKEEDGKLKKPKTTKQALVSVQHESKQQAKRLQSANKLVAELKDQVKAIASAEKALQNIHYYNRYAPAHIERVDQLISLLKSAGESQVENVVSAKKSLLNAKAENKAHVKNIAKADQFVHEFEAEAKFQEQQILKVEKLLGFLHK